MDDIDSIGTDTITKNINTQTTKAKKKQLKSKEQQIFNIKIFKSVDSAKQSEKMRVTYPQWTNHDGSNGRPNGVILNSCARQGKGKGKGNWNIHYSHHQHYNYNNGYPSYHNHNQSKRQDFSLLSSLFDFK